MLNVERTTVRQLGIVEENRMDGEQKKLIIIDGYLASGKSTFALRLSKSLNIPYLVKDTFKDALCQSVPITSRAESSMYSSITFDAILYVVERLFETANPVIIEGNFVPCGVKAIDEAGKIKQLIDKYGYSSLTFILKGDTRILHERFLKREISIERGRANKIGFDVPYKLFDQWCRNLDGFDVGGKIITVDTSDFGSVDFEKYICLAKRFLYEN